MAWLNVFFGLWLIASPFVLGFTHHAAALWNNIAVGIAVVLAAIVSRRTDGLARGALVLLGAWLFASPFILNAARSSFLWNNVILAFALVIGGASSGANDR
ncbi:MAG: SPW repeat protein [Verrucomicrobiota bacterium]